MIQRASDWTAGEIAQAVSGHLRGDPSRRLLGVATDTRDPLTDQLFVALVGEKHDAHEFLDNAVAGGATALLVEAQRLTDARIEGLLLRAALILVDDTTRALGDLAQARRRRSKAHVTALTGSNGKTSTKEMLAALLSVRHRVLKTQGNLNNLIGLPLTLLGAQREHEELVLEMGMNRLGEIARMVEIAEPDVGLVTNIGPAHVGELGGMDNVTRAKGEMFRGLSERAYAVVNLDDARVVAQALASGARLRRTFGRAEGADVRLLGSTPAGEGQLVRLAVDGTAFEATLPYPGEHNALNAAAAVAAATAGRSASLSDLAAGLAAADRVGGRLTAKVVGPWLVIDDSYNANSASTLAAIATVSERAKREGRRFVALLGEMRELGAYADEEHQKVGAAAALSGAALIAAFGPLAGPIAEEAEGRGVAAMHEAKEPGRLFDWIRPRLTPGDLILIKGSRGIHMEQFLKLLEEGSR